MVYLKPQHKSLLFAENMYEINNNKMYPMEGGDEGLEPALLDDWLKMKGWNRHCRMIGKKNDGLESTLSNDR